ncbi:MAG: DedA family protein [bacterium]|nr:DedA family protein [bacterium]MDO8742543.1 DedA family protein [bacterium]
MEFINTIAGQVSAFLSQHELLSYTVLFFGSYFETLIGVGFFVYGEMFFIPGALLAGAGILNIWIVTSVLILGGVLGDSSSYLIGRRYGISFFNEHNKIFNHTNYQRGLSFFESHGTKAIFLSRLLGPVSWITPFLAGTYGVPYTKFLGYNIAGVTVGIGQFLIIGYFFGSSYDTIISVIKDDAVVVGGVALLVLVVFYVYKRNRS